MNLTGMNTLDDLLAEDAVPFCRYHPKYHARTVYDYPVHSGSCESCWILWYVTVAKTLPQKQREAWLAGFHETISKMAYLEDRNLMPDPSTLKPRVDVVDK